MWRVKFKDFSRTFKAMYQQIQGLNTDEKGLEISKIWRWIFQNATLMSFEQLCQIWTPKINSTKWNGLSSTSLQIQGHSRLWIFVFKFKDIQELSSFVRTLKVISNAGLTLSYLSIIISLPWQLLSLALFTISLVMQHQFILAVHQ